MLRHGTPMDDPLAESASLAGRVFTRADALGAGYTSRQIETLLRRGQWSAIRAGVYVDAASADVGDIYVRTRAALLRLGPAAAASHQTAARLRGIALLGPRVASPTRTV